MAYPTFQKLLFVKLLCSNFLQDLHGSAAGTFENVAYLMGTEPELKFAITCADTLYNEYQVSNDDAVILFNKFGEGSQEMATSLTSVEALQRFIRANSLPLVAKFDDTSGKPSFNLVEVSG